MKDFICIIFNLQILSQWNSPNQYNKQIFLAALNNHSHNPLINKKILVQDQKPSQIIFIMS